MCIILRPRAPPRVQEEDGTEVSSQQLGLVSAQGWIEACRPQAGEAASDAALPALTSALATGVVLDWNTRLCCALAMREATESDVLAK